MQTLHIIKSWFSMYSLFTPLYIHLHSSKLYRFAESFCHGAPPTQLPLTIECRRETASIFLVVIDGSNYLYTRLIF